MAATQATQQPATQATITITDGNPNPNNNLFTINFNNSHTIQTTVTSDPTTVASWLATLTLPSPHRLIGLDVEWRPNFGRQYDNPIATLQLSTATSCLVFQTLHSPTHPSQIRPLADFLSRADVGFVGVGIRSDCESLLGDFGLRVVNVVDLGELAAGKIGGVRKGVGLKELARVVLGVEVSKPKSVTLSRWDCEWLSYAQIQYAAIDAFLSFRIGNALMSLPDLN